MAETKKTPAAKKPAAKKPAVKKASAASKPAAAKKVAVAKKPAVKKVAAKKPTAGKPNKIGAKEHYHMVEVAAYFIAERNKFAGNPGGYWAEAEAQIKKMLS